MEVCDESRMDGLVIALVADSGRTIFRQALRTRIVQKGILSAFQ